MRVFYIIICALITGTPMVAQGLEMGGHSFKTMIRPGDVFQRYNDFGLTEPEFNAIKNGMYANSTFILGSIYEDGKEMARDLLMRYNAYTDDIEVKQKKQDEDFSTLLKESNVSVKIAFDPFIYIPDNGAKERSGFMQVLVDGDKYKLYKKTLVTFHPAQKAKTSYDNDTPARFSQVVHYYLVQDANLTEIPSRKSKAESLLEVESSGMKSWLKKNKVDVRDEEDLKKAVEHLDSI